VPSAPEEIGGVRTASLILDFDSEIAGLDDIISQKELNTVFTFRYDNYPSGLAADKKLKALEIAKNTDGTYTLKVANVPSNGNTAIVYINKDGITPNSRLWNLAGQISLGDLQDVTPAMLDFRFEPGTKNARNALNAPAIGGIDQQKGTVVVVVPLGTDLSALDPTILTNLGNTYTSTPPDATDFRDLVSYKVQSSQESGFGNIFKFYDVTVIEQTQESAKIYSFVFRKEDNPGLSRTVSGVIDEGAKVNDITPITITVPYETDITFLAPFVVHSGGSILPANQASTDFSAPKGYTVTALNGTTASWYSVTVTVEENTGPPPGTDPVPSAALDLTSYIGAYNDIFSNAPKAGWSPIPDLEGDQKVSVVSVLFAVNSYYTGVVTWSKTGGSELGILPQGYFDNDSTYTATVVLTAKEYYTFAGVDVGNFIKHDGADSVSVPENPGSTITVTIVFPKTGIQSI
jgi:hypothetical protein